MATVKELSYELGVRLAPRGLRRLVTSPEEKARATATVLAVVLGVSVVTDDRLREVQRPWTDGNFADVVACYLHGDLIEGWEPVEQVVSRLETFLASRPSDGPIGVVTHRTAMTCLLGADDSANLSRGASANALARLEKLGLLHRSQGTRGSGSARSVVDDDSFIDGYATAAANLRLRQRVIRVHRLWKDPLEAFKSEIGPALNRASQSWAVTGAAASILLAPYLSDVTVVELYVDDDLFATPDHLADVLGGQVVDRGQLIEVRALPTSMSSKGPVVSGIHLALPARVYADLMAAGGRSADAAHHLRETVDVGPHS